ncbi:MAG TPA: hemolysin family protein [Longimicrobiales bacterium]|nr:hemolysin family protein [Longimicrobiales bacterium]
MLLLILGIVAALILSAFLTATELSVLSLSDGRVRTLVAKDFHGAAALARLHATPDRLLVLLRLGVSLADVTVAAFATLLAMRLGGGWTITILIITSAVLLLLYVARLLPLRLVAGHQVDFALRVAPGLSRVVRLLGPVLVLLERLARVVPMNREAITDSVSESEVRQITALGHREGLVDDQERLLIDRVFRMNETRAWDIMTPRVDMFAWPAGLLLREIAPQLRSVQYSRVPVYDDSIDDVVGVLYLRDAFSALVAGQRDVPIRELARDPLLVPGSLTLAVLLREFQNRRIHLAIVLDEYGGTEGIVTLEDVLEELVGEIVDETDVPDDPILRVSRNEIMAAGDTDLREINHYFNAALPLLEHRSLNGYLLEELGRVPRVGEHFERDGIEMDVLEATGTQVVKVRMRKGSAPQPGGGTSQAG